MYVIQNNKNIYHWTDFCQLIINNCLYKTSSVYTAGVFNLFIVVLVCFFLCGLSSMRYSHAKAEQWTHQKTIGGGWGKRREEGVGKTTCIQPHESFWNSIWQQAEQKAYLIGQKWCFKNINGLNAGPASCFSPHVLSSQWAHKATTLFDQHFLRLVQLLWLLPSSSTLLCFAPSWLSFSK